MSSCQFHYGFPILRYTYYVLFILIPIQVFIRIIRHFRYHSIIYELIDEVKGAMGGLLSPEQQESFIGYAEIRQVFSVSKQGKVAGCMVTEGIIKRGCKVRLLRDNVVIHEGSLKTLRRFKDEVKDVRDGMECGMAFDSYSDIQEGDMIECFEVKEIARTLD